MLTRWKICWVSQGVRYSTSACLWIPVNYQSSFPFRAQAALIWISLIPVQLQSSEAGLEAESSQWGVLKMLGWDHRVELNFDILTDNVLFDYVYGIIMFSLPKKTKIIRF